MITPLTFLHLVHDTRESPAADRDQYSLCIWSPCMSYANDPVQTRKITCSSRTLSVQYSPLLLDTFTNICFNTASRISSETDWDSLISAFWTVPLPCSSKPRAGHWRHLQLTFWQAALAGPQKGEWLPRHAREPVLRPAAPDAGLSTHLISCILGFNVFYLCLFCPLQLKDHFSW